MYRDPERGEQVVAEVDGKVVPLGVADITVSRKKGDTAPVAFKPREERIEIHNNGNSNGITVTSKGMEREVANGRIETVSSDATISIGYQTTLQLTTERDAKFVNTGDGKIVVGEDNSTTVGDDNVFNRTDIGGEEPAEVGDDNVFNRSSIGSESNPSDTISVNNQTSTPEPQPGSEETTSDTQFCIKCGSEISATALYCPNCGYDLGSNQPSEPGGDTAPSETATKQFCQVHDLAYEDACPHCDPANSN
ncbi:zinc ribbon domain-containing protein [Natronolimnobius baerhuensis]|uniref:Zinc ribbon domain-containing protein n=1 Tax=Natronolimnobius baerhuensis TaxID=253108 RepID=A0A202E3F3_9EURY|nr:zinc ribbon domain-containing protein [Natronolimnobius baerhuensis]